MQSIEIRNFRGVEKAVIEVDPVALLAGDNYSGKTSVLRAVAAALTGEAIPFLKPGSDGGYSATITKASAGCLVRGGAEKASVCVANAEGKATVAWPKAEVSSEGTPPTASVFATGLIRLPKLDTKKRTLALTRALKAEITREEFIRAMSGQGIGEEKASRTWENIEEQGWEAVTRTFTEHRAKNKGHWEASANEAYGGTKAEGWEPEGFEPDMKETSRDTLQQTLAAAKATHETTIAGQAVDADEIARLEADANMDFGDLATLKAKITPKRTAYEEAVKARDALPPSGGKASFLPCPHCGAPITLNRTGAATRLEKAVKLTKAEEKECALAIAGADGTAKKARTELQDAESALREAEQAANRAKGAATRLKEAKGKKGGGDVDAARETVRVAEERLSLFDRWTTATRAHSTVKTSQKVIDILSPTGLRKSKLANVLIAFNDSRLAPLCKTAGFKAVTITEDMEIEYGGRGYALLSKSEQYRLNATLQIALAQIDGSAMVLIDGADVLNKKGRLGLMKMLRASGVPAIVAMTILNPDNVPDLSRTGLGRTYWIEEGCCSAVVMGGEKEAA